MGYETMGGYKQKVIDKPELDHAIKNLSKAIETRDFVKYGWSALEKLLKNHEFSSDEKTAFLEQTHLMLKLWGTGPIGKNTVATITKKCLDDYQTLDKVGEYVQDTKILNASGKEIGVVKATNPVVLWMNTYREKNRARLAGIHSKTEKFETATTGTGGVSERETNPEVSKRKTNPEEKFNLETGPVQRELNLAGIFDKMQGEISDTKIMGILSAEGLSFSEKHWPDFANLMKDNLSKDPLNDDITELRSRETGNTNEEIANSIKIQYFERFINYVKYIHHNGKKPTFNELI